MNDSDYNPCTEIPLESGNIFRIMTRQEYLQEVRKNMTDKGDECDCKDCTCGDNEGESTDHSE